MNLKKNLIGKIFINLEIKKRQKKQVYLLKNLDFLKFDYKVNRLLNQRIPNIRGYIRYSNISIRIRFKNKI